MKVRNILNILGIIAIGTVITSIFPGKAQAQPNGTENHIVQAQAGTKKGPVDLKLDQFERLINELEIIMKRITQEGDMFAIPMATQKMGEMQPVTGGLVLLVDQMSETQMKRFADLCEKFNKVSSF